MEHAVTIEFIFWMAGVICSCVGIIFLLINAKIDRNARAIELNHEGTEKKIDAVNDRIKDVEQSVAAHRESSAARFVTREEIESKLDKIFSRFDKIENLIYNIIGKGGENK